MWRFLRQKAPTLCFRTIIFISLLSALLQDNDLSIRVFFSQRTGISSLQLHWLPLVAFWNALLYSPGKLKTDSKLVSRNLRLLCNCCIKNRRNKESYLLTPIQLTQNQLIKWNPSNLGQKSWRKHHSFPLPHTLLTEFMDSILLVCGWKGEELQWCLNYGTGLLRLAEKINQSVSYRKF